MLGVNCKKLKIKNKTKYIANNNFDNLNLYMNKSLLALSILEYKNKGDC